jgi:hypothetical protein
MISKLLKVVLITIFVASAGSVFATDDGTWHGDDHGTGSSMSVNSSDWLNHVLAILFG